MGLFEVLHGVAVKEAVVEGEAAHEWLEEAKTIRTRPRL
jgi:hypothetical protein